MIIDEWLISLGSVVNLGNSFGSLSLILLVEICLFVVDKDL